VNNMSLLVEIANYIQRYLNEQNISCVIGRHKLLLDKKAVSELLEKYSIDALMTKFGDTLEVKKRTAYDFSLSLNKEKIYVNIKTQDLETSQLSEVTWISSKSVIERVLQNPKIASSLYYLKISYIIDSHGKIVVKSADVAGPLSKLKGRLILYDKSQKTEIPYRIPTYYNGAHYFLHNDEFSKS